MSPRKPNEVALRKYCDSRIIALRNARYSWWAHWRELADYFLPRRYRWLVVPNQSNRGSPINQHIIDSTGCIAARNCASGILSGKSSPIRPWFKLKLGRQDSTQSTPTSLWLAECERLMYLVFHESNFYNSIATFYADLVVFGTATMLVYEDFDNVIHCINPCAGEFYLANDAKNRPTTFYREFTMTISSVVEEFGLDACSDNVQRLYKQPNGTGLSKEIVIGHAIEPHTEDKVEEYGIPSAFKFRECYWELGSAQQGGSASHGLLRCRGFFERPNIAGRWDLVSNDAYGRCPAMDALGDQKQLQLESRRKAQAIDKMVNPPMVADIQLKNQPASLLPGSVTYVAGFSSSGKPGFSSVYDTRFPVQEITEDLNEVRQRISKTFYNDLFQVISQYETRSNVSATEIDARKAEALIMIGPVLERIDNEVLGPVIERVFAIMVRAGVIPPPPQEIAGLVMTTEFVSMLAQAQSAAQTGGIERLLSLAGNLAGVDPAVMDNIDIDYTLDKFSALMGNDPKMIRSPDQLQAIRSARQFQQEQARKAELAEQLAKGAQTLSRTDVGGGMNALQAMTGVRP